MKQLLTLTNVFLKNRRANLYYYVLITKTNLALTLDIPEQADPLNGLKY